MNLSALVLHNVSRDTFFRYDDRTSKLYHAHEFQVVADNIETAADLVWTLTNVDDQNHLNTIRPDLSLYGQQVVAYRQRRNRSLSVGDVIVFRDLEDERYVGAVAVASMGFEQLYVRPLYDQGKMPEPNQTLVSEAYLAHETSWRNA